MKYLWVIFIYRCLNNNVQIFLLRNKEEFIPVVLSGVGIREFDKVKSLFTERTGIGKNDSYNSRFFEYSHSFSSKDKDKNQIISTSSVRPLDETYLKNSKFFKMGDWFTKEEAYEELKNNNLYFRAFKLEFKADSFWECLDTKRNEFPGLRSISKKDRSL